MKQETVDRLHADGWKLGSAESFLRLSDEERRLVELKLSLSRAVRRCRVKRGISQIDLAERMKSSQSRIAKIEAGDPSVSLDLIVRALIASGATARDIQSAFVVKGALEPRPVRLCSKLRGAR